jgi:hypothetical protein
MSRSSKPAPFVIIANTTTANTLTRIKMSRKKATLLLLIIDVMKNLLQNEPID